MRHWPAGRRSQCVLKVAEGFPKHTADLLPHELGNTLLHPHGHRLLDIWHHRFKLPEHALHSVLAIKGRLPLYFALELLTEQRIALANDALNVLGVCRLGRWLRRHVYRRIKDILKQR